MLPPLDSLSILKDRYKVIGIIGQGGMGSIYKAEDTRLEGRTCAIKEIQIDVNASPTQQQQAREQFYREATVLARLDHPNLPKVSDFFDEQDRDFLVMDYIPGIDLRQRIEEQRSNHSFIPEKELLNWAEQLCDALTYLHHQEPPVVHRDIKPANIKLTPDGRIKLVDFGLVKIMTPDDTRTITVIQGRGTVLYTPLEQYGGDVGHTDPRTDLYSLGATLYHLATNEPPLEAKERFLHPGALRRPRQINPELSNQTEKAIMWAMGMHPDDRPGSVEEWLSMLHGTGDVYALPRSNDRIAFDRINWVLGLGVFALLTLAVLITLVQQFGLPGLQ
ncbi:MAG: serine/threonine protein kinase [Chloroflexi bacterium]|nr:serine/threonine protein kinase [Chloroflexota bacterium]